MKRTHLFTGFSLVLFLILLSQITVQTGCANIVPPEGGARDSLPPVLGRAFPENNTKNFTGNRITLVLDEYVELDNPFQNVIISPLPKNTPNISRKLNEITIKLRDSLEANTTYSLNFGKTIKDVNEGNIMKDFTYIFSTGSYIDSLQLSGRIILAETGETDSTLTVMLHHNPADSALTKERPRYITKTNGAGRFVFKNLPPGTFYMYALKDEGGSYRYLNPKALFAFADSSVTTGRQADSIVLYAYEGKDNKPVITTPGSSSRNTRTAADKRLRFLTNLQGSKQDLLQKFTFTFETPLKNFDSTKIRFASDSTFTPVTGYHWQFDSTMKTATLNYQWRENTLYHFILEKDFATDTLGQQLLKADTLSFTTMKNDEYGRLLLRFRNLDLSKNPVLLLVQNNKVVNSFPLTSAVLSQPLFLPGEYNLRLLYDTNKNGVWDPGEFFGKRKQPELVKPIERKINIRPGAGDEIQVAL